MGRETHREGRKPKLTGRLYPTYVSWNLPRVVSRAPAAARAMKTIKVQTHSNRVAGGGNCSFVVGMHTNCLTEPLLESARICPVNP